MVVKILRLLILTCEHGFYNGLSTLWSSNLKCTYVTKYCEIIKKKNVLKKILRIGILARGVAHIEVKIKDLIESFFQFKSISYPSLSLGHLNKISNKSIELFRCEEISSLSLQSYRNSI